MGLGWRYAGGEQFAGGERDSFFLLYRRGVFHCHWFSVGSTVYLSVFAALDCGAGAGNQPGERGQHYRECRFFPCARAYTGTLTVTLAGGRGLFESTGGYGIACGHYSRTFVFDFVYELSDAGTGRFCAYARRVGYGIDCYDAAGWLFW
jgi:hypothetical protein